MRRISNVLNSHLQEWNIPAFQWVIIFEGIEARHDEKDVQALILRYRKIEK